MPSDSVGLLDHHVSVAPTCDWSVPYRQQQDPHDNSRFYGFMRQQKTVKEKVIGEEFLRPIGMLWSISEQ